MNRRIFLTNVVLLPLTLKNAALAQRGEGLPIVGVMRGSSFDPNDPSRPPFIEAMREFGYEDGRSIRMDTRYAEGHPERLPQIAADLIKRNVDVIITANEPALRAAKQATTGTPIVMLAWDYDPVESGLIDSPSHPGGNVTGLALQQSELVAKRLELLKEALQQTRRVIVFWDSLGRKQLQELEPAARLLDVRVKPVEVRNRSGLINLFRQGFHKGDAGMFLYSPAFFVDRVRIAAEARDARLPTVFQEEWFVKAGGLLSYGPDIHEAARRTAYFVDRLLKGAKPSDLPVERVSKLRMVVNLKTAKSIDVAIPNSVLTRADEVIS